MPLFLVVGWSWIQSFWAVTLLPLLAKIPWQVWVALGVLVAFLYYGHVREARGVAKCEAQVEVVRNQEIARQQKVADQAVEASKAREAEALAKANITQEELDNALRDVAKLKEANKVCLPRSITDGLRGMRSRTLRSR